MTLYLVGYFAAETGMLANSTKAAIFHEWVTVILLLQGICTVSMVIYAALSNTRRIYFLFAAMVILFVLFDVWGDRVVGVFLYV